MCIRNKISIGIVEDHLLFRKSVVTFLNSTNSCKVAFELSNGRDVVNQLKKHSPNILLLDLQMPEVDGFEALQEIREKIPTQKIIIYSSLYTREVGLTVIENQIQDYLPKQVPLEVLQRTIEKINDAN